MATRFHLVRHACYDMVGHILAGRHSGLALNAQGRAEAGRLADVLGARPIAAVVSSPRRRAIQTAEPLAARLALALNRDPGFDEIDFGAWTGATFAELEGQPAWRAFNVFRSAAPVPGGESMLAAQSRAVAALLRWRVSVPDGEVVVVSHADVLKSVVAHFLGMPLDLLRRLDLAPAGRCELVLFEEDARLDGFNLRV